MTLATTARRAELIATIRESLAEAAVLADRAQRARAELLGDGETFCDPLFLFAPHFGRAIDDLIYAVHVAMCLNPDQEP
ncbi:hypothetical protein [Nocardia sp. NPDC051832]|uniref:hypothetical protein n=1 Tax=Nocardia sp. NPDC051832 TaxID=3155673 RepID=UPI003435512B